MATILDANYYKTLLDSVWASIDRASIDQSYGSTSAPHLIIFAVAYFWLYS